MSASGQYTRTTYIWIIMLLLKTLAALFYTLIYSVIMRTMQEGTISYTGSFMVCMSEQPIR